MLLDRHWLVKALVLASAVPIALLTNILRITATGMADVWIERLADEREGSPFIHDFYGLMMPVGRPDVSDAGVVVVPASVD